MTTATQYAGLAMLARFDHSHPLVRANPTGDSMDSGYPPYHCIPTTVDSSDEQKNYCEGWRAFRRGW